MIVLLALCSLISSTTSFTPPKIVYGGWTPILPGHPFFFGGSNKQYYDQHQVQSYSSSSQRPQHHSKYLYHSQAPTYHSGAVQQIEYGNHGHHVPQTESYQHHQISYNTHPREHRKKPKSQKPKKNIFAYYPPQSSYDSPSQHGSLDYKPVYIEIPRKPTEILENPHNFVPYILPSLKGLFPKDIKLADYGKEQTYFKIHPLGKVDPQSIHPIGHINLEKLQYIPGLQADKEVKSNYDSSLPVSYRNQEKTEYQSPVHSSGHRYEPNYNYISNNHVHSTEPHNINQIVNNFRGTNFPHYGVSDAAPKHQGSSYQDISGRQQTLLSYQPVKDASPPKSIAASYYLNTPDYRNQAYPIDSSHLQNAQTYQTKPEIYPEAKYTSSDSAHSETTQNLIMPSTTSGNLAEQVKNLLGSKLESYNPSKSYYVLDPQRSFLSPGRYHFAGYPNNPSGAGSYQDPKNSLMPKLLESYVPKNAKVKEIYRNPSVLTHIQGTPAIVEREVAIVHVPVDSQAQYSSNAASYIGDSGEVMYLTASTPKSTEVRNDSHFSPQREHNSHFILNETFTHHNYNPNEHSEAINKEDAECIFVGTRGLIGDDIRSVAVNSGEDGASPKESSSTKQYFHAYYAPSDHVPPKGYLKMSVAEFHKLFKNAEIQYIKRDQADAFRSIHKA
ncbi:uncharacterized protein TNCV_3775731 [Trichonephila clavipes]|nr:uncharacterized protein TNCV_3775731 [Trichonephila clavipes]